MPEPIIAPLFPQFRLGPATNSATSVLPLRFTSRTLNAAVAKSFGKRPYVRTHPACRFPPEARAAPGAKTPTPRRTRATALAAPGKYRPQELARLPRWPRHSRRLRLGPRRL